MRDYSEGAFPLLDPLEILGSNSPISSRGIHALGAGNDSMLSDELKNRLNHPRRIGYDYEIRGIRLQAGTREIRALLAW